MSIYTISRSLLGLILLISIVILASHNSAAQATKASLKELSETSNAILTGKCEKKESFWNSSRTKIFTEVKIRTEESMKGNPGAEVIVTVPGGQVGNTVYEVSDMPSFAEGEEVLLFLWKHPSGKNLVTGALQGKLTVVEEKSTGRKVVQGGSFLLEGSKVRDAHALEKAGIEGTEIHRIYLDDLKATIQTFVHQ